MNPTPEQQRHALDRLLEICKNDVLPHDYGITEELVKDADAFLRTVLREHGEMRKALVLVKPKCGVGCDCAVSVALSSIPDRSVRDQDRCSCSPIRGEAHEWPCGHPNCYRLSSSDRSVPPTA